MSIDKTGNDAVNHKPGMYQVTAIDQNGDGLNDSNGSVIKDAVLAAPPGTTTVEAMPATKK